MVRMDSPAYGLKIKHNDLCNFFPKLCLFKSTYIVTAQGFRVRPEAGRFRPFAYHFIFGTLTL